MRDDGMTFVRLHVSAALACVALIAACGHPAGWFTNFPGTSCTDRGSIGAVRDNYANWRAHKARATPAVIWPELRAIHKISDVPVDPASPLEGMQHCMGLAAFTDGTTEAIRFGWSREFKPNWVSANAGLFWCIDGLHDRCPDPMPAPAAHAE